MHTLYFVLNIIFILLYICDGLEKTFEEKEKEEEIAALRKEISELQNTGDE